MPGYHRVPGTDPRRDTFRDRRWSCRRRSGIGRARGAGGRQRVPGVPPATGFVSRGPVTQLGWHSTEMSVPDLLAPWSSQFGPDHIVQHAGAVGVAVEYRRALRQRVLGVVTHPGWRTGECRAPAAGTPVSAADDSATRTAAGAASRRFTPGD